MKSNKLEDQFKEKLQNRSIEPSDKAWDRLDAMLSVAEKKKKPYGKWWFVAAGFLALISVSSLFFRFDGNTLPSEEMVLETTNQQLLPSDKEIQQEDAYVFEEVSIESVVIPKDTFLVVTLPIKTETIDVAENEEQNYDEVDNQITVFEELAPVYPESQSLTLEVIQPKNNIKIDYKSLLHNTEVEVETQYSRKALDRFLERNYNNIRLAVTKKNQE